MRRQVVRATYNSHIYLLSIHKLTVLALSLSLLVKINLCYFVEFWSGERVLIIWGLRLICLKPVEESNTTKEVHSKCLRLEKAQEPPW